MQKPKGLRTWIEVDKKAIAHNYRIFRSLISKKTKLMAVVKSNAYGHGLIDFSNEVGRLGADWLGVDSIVEGVALRKSGLKKPILVLGSTLPEMVFKAAEGNISLAVSTLSFFDNLPKFSNRIKIHIKVDTGMHRHGFLEKDLLPLIKLLKKNKDRIVVEGLFTHFAAAKNPALLNSTKEQMSVFERWIAAFKKSGFNVMVHASATGGVLTYPDANLDMVRIGIGMYGLWPSKETKEYFRNRIHLKPVMTWKTVVTEIKKFGRGSKFGYDFSGVVGRDSKVAICPVGYWHGYSRGLSGVGSVYINGYEGRVLGRVSMDIVIVDVTDVRKIKLGDEVVLLGRSGKREMSAEYLADLEDGSWYELITRLNPLIKRIYV